MTGRHHLLQLLLALLAAQGLAAECLDPWRGWVTFKQYVRVVDEIPDPGVSVQFVGHPDASSSLFFLRQVLEPAEDNWLEPVGGVVCEFLFSPSATEVAQWEFWSFDHPTFEQFVDAVEQHPPFVELVAKAPEWSGVYWEEV